MISPRTLALLALLPIAPLAHADTITAGAVSPIALGPSADSLSLNAATANVSAPGVFTQTGTFNVGDSGQLNSTINFSFVENVILNGVSKAVTISGSDAVTPAYDTLTIFPTGPISIGNATWSLRGFNLTAAEVQPYSFNMTADIGRMATPEPAGLALLGSGAFATAMVTRRRHYFA